MNRDLDLIRRMLLALERRESAVDSTTLYIKGYSQGIVVEHALLLIEQGLVEGLAGSMPGAREYILIRLTLSGHDFLAAIRDDTVWNRTKEAVGSTVQTTTLEPIKAVAKKISHNIMGIP